MVFLLARMVTLRDFGLYAMVVAIVSLTEAIFVSRSGEVALRLIGQQWVKGDGAAVSSVARQIIRSDIYINVLVYGLLVGCTLLFADFINVPPVYVVVLGLAIPLQIGYGVIKAVFVAADRLGQQAVLEATMTIVQVAAGLMAAYYHGLLGLFTVFVVSVGLKNFIAWRMVRPLWAERFGCIERASASSDVRIEVREHMWPLMRCAAVNGMNNIDIMLINTAMGTEATGIYKAAKTLATGPAKIGAPLWTVLRPHLLRLVNGAGSARDVRTISILSGVLALLFACIAYPLLIYSEALVVTLYGEQYAKSGLIFFILVVGAWFFHVVSGWISFVSVVSNAQLASVALYCSMFFMILVVGSAYAERGLVAIATVVSTTLVAGAIAGWLLYFRVLSGPKP